MRIKRGVLKKSKKKRYLKAAKGYRGAKSRRVSLAKEQFFRSGVYAFAGRKQKKRDYRKLWIVRINAAARMNEIKYNELIHGLKEAGVRINRKMLSDLAATDMNAFKAYVEIAKEALNS